jgi:hypothetical protein
MHTSMPRASELSIRAQNPLDEWCTVVCAPWTNGLDLSIGVKEQDLCVKPLHLNFLFVARLEVKGRDALELELLCHDWSGCIQTMISECVVLCDGSVDGAWNLSEMAG